jgi:F0F1-type ATP synthase assembly protein I
VVRADWRGSGGYATVGLELVLSLLLGYLAGRWLDGRFGTEPYLGSIGAGFGAIAGFRAVWRAAKRMSAETERDGFQASQTDRVPRRKDDGKA